MFESRASRRRGVTYAVLLALSLVLLALSGSPPVVELRRGIGFALAPIQGALAGATRTATSIFDALAEIEELRRSNQDLAAQVQRLEIEARQLEAVRIQNEELTALLQLKSVFDYETVAAEVIGRQTSTSERGVTLSQGADRGIEEGDIVVAEGGALVGRVIEAGANYSRVMLISDTRSVVVGAVEASRATGEVQGQASAALLMSRIPSSEAVVVGETVLTAGIDLGNGIRSPFPRGLVVGRVVDVQQDPNAVVQSAIVEPAAALEQLEYVLVITDYEGGILLAPSPGASAGEPAASEGAGATASPEASSGDGAPASDAAATRPPVP